MANDTRADLFINTLIGEGSLVTGDLRVEGLLRIDGDLLGTANTSQRLLVGEKGRVKGSLSAQTVVIGGVVKGDISAKQKVTLLSGSLVIGNIFSPRLVVEEGCILEGYCSIHDVLTDAPLGQFPGQATFKLVIPSRKEAASSSVRSEIGSP